MGMLDGKVLFITGGSTGIGRGALEVALEEGASCAIFNRNAEKGEAVARDARSRGYNVEFFQTDVSDRESVERSFSAAFDKFGKVNALLNNAGIMTFHGKPDEKKPEDEEAFRNIIDIDLLGAYYCATEVIQYLRKNDNGGAIVNTASIGAIQSSVGFCGYPISKAGVLGLTIGFANTYGFENIRTNAVSPGYIETEGMQQDDAPHTEGVDYTEYIPMKRFGTPRDIGKVMVFLASDYAEYINGANIIVDGGAVTRMPD